MLACCGAALLCLALWTPAAHAYPMYNDGFGTGCFTCHDGFSGGPQHPLHAMHTSKFGITECNLCHSNGPGSTPVRTYTSGSGGGFGCVGCHGNDYGETSSSNGLAKASGYGLRQVHANNGVTVCATCHKPGLLGARNPFPAILPESVKPPYYKAPFSNLRNPCASSEEDSTFDVNLVGLDNDGNGFSDWPADATCSEPTTTTTTTSTTTTTLPVACGLAPAGGCVAADGGQLMVSEKASGKEKLKVGLTKLHSAVTQSTFGDPVTGGTSYAICVYDASDTLRDEISVARPGDSCGTPPKPCWSLISTKGYKYADKTNSADGISKMTLLGGDAGKGKIAVGGKNNASAGQTSLPTGIAALLQSSTHATVQILTVDAGCFTVTVTQVKKADGATFIATAP